jgi:hypothetical protein
VPLHACTDYSGVWPGFPGNTCMGYCNVLPHSGKVPVGSVCQVILGQAFFTPTQAWRACMLAGRSGEKCDNEDPRSIPLCDIHAARRQCFQ